MRVLVALLMFWHLYAQAAPLVKADHTLSQLDIGASVRYLADVGQHYSNDLLYLDKDTLPWKKAPKEGLNFGFNHQPHWLWVQIENTAERPVQWVLKIDYPLLDFVDAYIYQQDNTLQHWQAGDYYPFDKRPIDHRHILFPLSLKGSEKINILLRVQTEGALQIPLKLWDESAFHESEHVTFVLHGTIFGIFLIMIIYNTFLFITVRDWNYFYYVGFTSFFILFLIALSGYGYQHFWQNWYLLQQYSIIFFAGGNLIWVSLFTRSFLNIDVSNAYRHYTLRGLSIAGSIALLSSFILPYNIQIFGLMLLSIIACLLFMLVGISSWFDRGKIAQFYTISWFMVAIGVSISSMDKLGFIHYHELSAYAPPIAVCAQALLLSLALGLRIKSERNDRMKAQSLALESQKDALRAKLRAKEVAFESEQIQMKAEAESKAKNEFLAIMSHEIRTPLNGIMGMADLLRTTSALDEQQRRYVNTIYSSGESLLTIINDILDFSKIQAGKLEIENIPLSLMDLIEDSTSIFSQHVKTKGLTLLASVYPPVPIIIKSDPVRLRQVILNYVSNAVKFTEHGEIQLKVALDSEEKTLKIIVSDTGIGVPDNKKNELFNFFSQADNSTTRKYGGTGLGLAICHRLSQLMSGSTGMESTQGKGSKFWFTCKVDLPQGLQKNEKYLNKQTVGIQLKNSNETQWLNEHCHFWGGDTLKFTIGETTSALDWLIIEYDSIKETTVETLSKVHNIPVERIISVGDFDQTAHLRRPLTTSDVHRVIAAPNLATYGTGISSNTVNELPLNGCRILVAEDNKVNQMVITALLRKLGADLKVVENGELAVNEVCSAHNDFDLILMDCEMPITDGFTASQQIREYEAKEAISPIPIIALTAHAMDIHRKKAFESGMNGFITKPVKQPELLQAISEVLSECIEAFIHSPDKILKN